MEHENKLINGICKLAGSALNTAVNAKNDLSELIKHQVESFIRSMNFVTKEEFEALKKTVVALKKDKGEEFDKEIKIENNAKNHNVGQNKIHTNNKTEKKQFDTQPKTNNTKNTKNAATKTTSIQSDKNSEQAKLSEVAKKETNIKESLGNKNKIVEQKPKYKVKPEVKNKDNEQ